MGTSLRTGALAIAALCIAATAFAQNAPTLFVPEFESEPSPAQLVRHYPPAALRQNVSGIAVLCCVPRADRSLECAVNSEWPAGQGFGQASVRASSVYRLTPASDADLRARREAIVRLSLMWAGPVVSPDTVANLQRIDRDTMFACHEAVERRNANPAPVL